MLNSITYIIDRTSRDNNFISDSHWFAQRRITLRGILLSSFEGSIASEITEFIIEKLLIHGQADDRMLVVDDGSTQSLC